MFKPLSICIGFRYTRAKKRNHFVSFISLSSMLGIALGVAVLITVLSVMNGFDHEIHTRFFGMAPEITVNDYSGKVEDWQKLGRIIDKMPGVIGSAPFVGGQGLLSNFDEVSPSVVTGISPQFEGNISNLTQKMQEGSLDSLQQGRFNIVLGKALAARLGVMLGDKVTLMIPQTSVTLAGVMPRFKRFTLSGIFSAGPGFNFDSRLAFINLEDAQKLFQLDDAVTGLRVKIKDVYSAPYLSQQLRAKLPRSTQVSNWTDQFGAFFKAVKMEKTMMFLILILIIAVAAFNLVSSLVMVVNDKQSEIAILRTLGAMPRTILAIFMVQGLFVGVFGTLLGLIGGIALALNATEIVSYLQQIFHMEILSSNVYFVDYLPSRLQWADVVEVCAVALLMSFLATIYPAWRASKTQPAEALRYE